MFSFFACAAGKALGFNSPFNLFEFTFLETSPSHKINHNSPGLLPTRCGILAAQNIQDCLALGWRDALSLAECRITHKVQLLQQEFCLYSHAQTPAYNFIASKMFCETIKAGLNPVRQRKGLNFSHSKYWEKGRNENLLFKVISYNHEDKSSSNYKMIKDAFHFLPFSYNDSE